MIERVLMLQSASWDRRRKITGSGGDPYAEDRCCYCYRTTKPGAARVMLTRTNDGEWWVVHPDAPVLNDERQMGDPHFVLPIGADCLRRHPEFRIGLVIATAGAVVRGGR